MKPTVFAAFDRAMLRETFSEVKALIPQAAARDVGVCRTSGDDWTGELNRPCYGGHFHWCGRAANAWHAKQQTWAAWLKKNGRGDQP